MRRFVFAAAAAALLLSTAGCQDILNNADGPMTGTWRFTVTGHQVSPTHPEYLCDLETIYVIRQEGKEMEGRSEAAHARCTDHNVNRTYPSLKEAGVVRGPVENGRIDITDSGNWNCQGDLHPTRIEGVMAIYWGEPTQVTRVGTCVLEKISDEGYDGPPA